MHDFHHMLMSLGSWKGCIVAFVLDVFSSSPSFSTLPPMTDADAENGMLDYFDQSVLKNWAGPQH
jgi:hypothetical protein